MRRGAPRVQCDRVHKEDPQKLLCCVRLMAAKELARVLGWDLRSIEWGTESGDIPVQWRGGRRLYCLWEVVVPRARRRAAARAARAARAATHDRAQ